MPKQTKSKRKGLLFLITPLGGQERSPINQAFKLEATQLTTITSDGGEIVRVIIDGYACQPDNKDYYSMKVEARVANSSNPRPTGEPAVPNPPPTVVKRRSGRPKKA